MSSGDIFDRLTKVIEQRRAADPDSSYVAKLLMGGSAKAAQKVGEEAVETVIAALQGDRAALTAESADLIFHLMVVLAQAGLSLDDVAAELARREGLSGLTEKARRGSD